MEKLVLTLMFLLGSWKLSADDSSAWFEAAEKGDLAQITKLMDDGFKIDKKNGQKQTALMLAAKAGRADVTALLVARGADVTLMDSHKHNLLHFAVMGGDLALMKVLKQRGVSFKAANKDSLTPLLLAAQYRQREALALLVEWGADPHQKTRQGDTALHLAAAHNGAACIDYLVGLGLDVNAKGRDATTPLLNAVISGSLDAVQTLLNLGADPEQADRWGNKPMNFVSFLRNRSLYRMICDHGWSGAALHCSVRGGALEEVRKQLTTGVSKEATNPAGETPLFVAVSEGQLEIAKELLAQGAQVDATTGYQWTPLYAAAWRGDLAMVKVLLSHGAKAYYPVAGGDTPLGIALEGGYQDVAAALVEAGGKYLFFKPGTRTGYKIEQVDFDALLKTREEAMASGEFERASCPFWLLRYDEDAVRDVTGSIWSDKLGGATGTEKGYEVLGWGPEGTQKLPSGHLFERPVFTSQVPPQYPEAALKSRLQGYLVLALTLGKDGISRDIKILRPLGNWHYGFELEAVKAVRQWQYKPATLDGEPCDVRMTLKIDFLMNNH